MSLWRLVTREILFRKLNFALALLSVLVAVGCLVAELTLLRKHDLQTEQIIAQKEAETAAKLEQRRKETEAAAKLLEDDYREITLKLRFNIQILPKDQNLGDLYTDDYGKKTMPEEYAERLAKSSIVTVNHLLPSLRQKIKWPEQERTIILIGVRGEIPILHADPKKPLLQPVPPGKMVLGHELHRSVKLAVGDRVKLMGKDFTVHQLHDERGNKDDITAWINLREAQELLDRTGQINAILALECNCEANRLDKVREEIASILPDTQVIEFASQALTRAESRVRAGNEAKRQLEEEKVRAARDIEDEKAGRAQLRQELESFAHVLVPLVLAGCVVWVGVLGFNNVRERRTEIGILRALGVGSGRVFSLFFIKAVLVGFLGAVLGYAAGALIGMLWGETSVQAAAVFNPLLLLAVIIAAPLLCALASWIPATLAARQDPSVVLREE